MGRKIVESPFPARAKGEDLTASFLGLYVKAIRTKKKFTIHEAAAYCNVPVDVFSKLENNKGGVTLDSFLKVANGVGLKLTIESMECL